MRGRKPKPTAVKLAEGNPGKRAINRDEPVPHGGKPTCPSHLSPVAKAEWRRLCGVLFDAGMITSADRAALAAYCQAYGRWVEAEKRLAETPMLIKTPSGYVQQSPWLSIANKQSELMGRYMAELGITPAARSRLKTETALAAQPPLIVEVVTFTGAPGPAEQAEAETIELEAVEARQNTAG